MAFKLRSLTGKIISNPFLVGSLVMVIGSNIYNIGQFAYHFLAGRFLGKASYGDLAAIISLLGIVAIVHSALNMSVVKYIASEKNGQKISNFIKWVYHWSIWFSLFAAVLIILISPILSRFINITDPWVIYLLGPILLFNILITTGRSILQGLIKFNQYVLSLLVESIIKISLSLLLIILGFAVFGALGGMLVGLVVSFFVVQSSLSKYLYGKKGIRPAIAPLLKYSSSTFIQGIALTSMYSTDLILVKHFFSSDTAGIYASLAVLGRIVFFGASPVIQVMFPMVAKRYSTGDSHRPIFYLSMFLVIVFAAVSTLAFYLFPQFIIGLLYGNGFLEGAVILWWFGVFMSLLALAMLFTQYYLSIGQTKVVWLFALAAVSQIILIWLVHPDILTVIQLSILVAALLVVSLFIYFLYQQFHGKDKKQ